jgi:hypothetical protein
MPFYGRRVRTSGDRPPACDRLASAVEVDVDDPLTVECSDTGSQLTGILFSGEILVCGSCAVTG